MLPKCKNSTSVSTAVSWKFYILLHLHEICKNLNETSLLKNWTVGIKARRSGAILDSFVWNHFWIFKYVYIFSDAKFIATYVCGLEAIRLNFSHYQVQLICSVRLRISGITTRQFQIEGTAETNKKVFFLDKGKLSAWVMIIDKKKTFIFKLWLCILTYLLHSAVGTWLSNEWINVKYILFFGIENKINDKSKATLLDGEPYAYCNWIDERWTGGYWRHSSVSGFVRWTYCVGCDVLCWCDLCECCTPHFSYLF